GLSGTAALPLDGRVAIVTGASRGIGRAIAAHLSSLGASVVLGYASSAAEADALAVELPRAVAVRADVSDEASVRSLFDAAESAFRCAAPHILVANAGVIDDKYPSLADTTTADFDHAFAVNTRGAFLYLPRGRQPHAPRRRRPDRGSDDVRGWESCQCPRNRPFDKRSHPLTVASNQAVGIAMAVAVALAWALVVAAPQIMMTSLLIISSRESC
uniref:Uncharacterized protein n=1 Tax=Aegilops tauschii subsp. strangulata TaxID=200361 RepID=A0A453J1Q1_AEGTS